VSRKKTKVIIYSLLLFFSFLFVFFRSNIFAPLKFSIVKGTSLPVRLLSFPFQELKKILFYHWTYDEYLRLRREVSTLEQRLMMLDEVVRENSRLEQLLNFKRKLVYETVAANVIGRDPSNWSATVLIDKGQESGVAVGMPVVVAQGVVGKIAEVSNDRAKVILLSDPSFSVAALVLRSRESGLVSGTLLGMCRMRYLSSRADIRVGDRIITSKLSTAFPEGLLLGQVISMQTHERNPIIDCIIEPAVTLSQLEEVMVIKNE
jgi:rod shape-determining protein MreC